LVARFLHDSFVPPLPPPPTSTLFPYTTLFRSSTVAGSPSDASSAARRQAAPHCGIGCSTTAGSPTVPGQPSRAHPAPARSAGTRSEEHTSELQSRENLVCRLLLEKKTRPQRDQ